MAIIAQHWYWTVCVGQFIISPCIALPLFLFPHSLSLLIFHFVWPQHLRVIQTPTLPTLRHLETLQFHPIWARHPPHSPFHQVPSPTIAYSSYAHLHPVCLLFIYHPLCPVFKSSLCLYRCTLLLLLLLGNCWKLLLDKNFKGFYTIEST